MFIHTISCLYMCLCVLCVITRSLVFIYCLLQLFKCIQYCTYKSNHTFVYGFVVYICICNLILMCLLVCTGTPRARAPLKPENPLAS